MGRKTPPFPEYPEWTTAKFWGFIRSGIRAKWVRWPPRYAALAEVKRTVKGKRHKYEYRCSSCRRWYKSSEVEVDHIIPVGRLAEYNDLAGFVKKMFVGKEGLRVVCKPCHKRITNDSVKRQRRKS